MADFEDPKEWLEIRVGRLEAVLELMGEVAENAAIDPSDLTLLGLSNFVLEAHTLASNDYFLTSLSMESCQQKEVIGSKSYKRNTIFALDLNSTMIRTKSLHSFSRSQISSPKGRTISCQLPTFDYYKQGVSRRFGEEIYEYTSNVFTSDCFAYPRDSFEEYSR